jgi:hypothetical protein
MRTKGLGTRPERKNPASAHCSGNAVVPEEVCQIASAAIALPTHRHHEVSPDQVSITPNRKEHDQ